MKSELQNHFKANCNGNVQKDVDSTNRGRKLILCSSGRTPIRTKIAIRELRKSEFSIMELPKSNKALKQKAILQLEDGNVSFNKKN